jgi:hypothetical protein
MSMLNSCLFVEAVNSRGSSPEGRSGAGDLKDAAADHYG